MHRPQRRYFAMIIACMGLLHGWTCSAVAQTALLGGFDFTEPGYVILIVPVGRCDSGSTGTMISYFDDAAALMRLQAQMVYLPQTGSDFAKDCPADSYLYVIKNGQKLREMRLSILQKQCNWLSFGDIYYQFEGYIPFEDYKLASCRLDDFRDVAEGRKALKEMRAQNQALWIGDPAWERYEGEFDFRVHVETRKSTLQMKEEYTAVLLRHFPAEKFEIAEVRSAIDASGSGTYTFKVQCRKAMYDRFTIYEMSESGWRPYSAEIQSYWR